MELPRQESDDQNWRSRAHSFGFVSHQARADHIYALRFTFIEASGSRLGFSDAYYQFLGRERLSNFRGLLSHARPVGRLHSPRGFVFQARLWHRRRFAHARELSLI